MKYKAFIDIDCDCPNFKKHHHMPLHDSAATTESECLEKAKQILSDMRSAYERSGWLTSDNDDGFIGQQGNSINAYSSVTIEEIDMPVISKPVQKRAASSVTEKETAFLADLADLCKRFGIVIENC